MAKTADQSVYDAALNVIKGATRQTIVTTQPVAYAGTYATQLAQVTMAGTDYTLAAGDASPTGRKITMSAKNGVSITATGTANWVVLDDGSSKILYVTSCTAVTLTSGQTVNIPAWKVDIAGPT
jgi:hypothetical protein